MNKVDIKDIVEISRLAGLEILKIYKQDFEVFNKNHIIASANFANVEDGKQVIRSSGSVVGPTLQPIGLATPRRNSTCAPSG